MTFSQELAFDAHSFKWDLPAGGFRILQASELNGAAVENWALVENRDVQGRRDYEGIDTDGATYREFAELDVAKPEEILPFANRYGSLGFRKEVVGEDGRVVRYEADTNWKLCIEEMKHLVALCDAWRGKDVAWLARHVRWSVFPGGDGVTGLWTCPGATSVVGPEYDIEIAAITLLYRSINAPLQGRGLYDRPPRGHALDLSGRGASLQLQPSSNGLSLRVVARDLVTALWVQFARAVAESREYSRCLDCKKWFEISRDGRRARKVFCGDTCKMRDYRRRRDRAHELGREGLTAKQVFDRLKMDGLETDLETVKEWIKSKR